MRRSVVVFAALSVAATVPPNEAWADDAAQWAAESRNDDKRDGGIGLILLGSALWAGDGAAIAGTVSSHVCHRDHDTSGWFGGFASLANMFDGWACGGEVFGEVFLGAGATAALVGGVVLTVTGAKEHARRGWSSKTIQVGVSPAGVVLRGTF